MKKTSLKLLILVFVVIILDRGLGIIIKYQFDSATYGLYGNMNSSLNSSSEIVILGSSRALHHYVPDIISKNLGQTCYNTGIGGYGIFYNYAILKSIIKTSKPKTVILDISPNVVSDNLAYSKLNVFLPYCDTDSSFLEIVKLNTSYNWINRISKLYTYNSTLYDIFRSNISEVKTIQGYSPLSGTIDTNNFSSFHLETTTLDSIKVFYFRKIISICKENNINLLVVVSPTYIKFDLDNRYIKEFRSICQNNKVKFLDFSNYSELYGNELYFKDQLHMNSNGANLFSNKLANTIKPYCN